jgi:hypothetical protein
VSEEKPVHIPFHAKDHASGVIGKITHHVGELGERVDESVHKLTEMGGAIAGIAGGLGFERMMETGKESLESISKMAKLTGTSAQNVAALRDTFEQSGLSAEAMAGTITRLGKNTLKLEEGGKQLAAEAQRWGINLKEGPVKAIETMSEAVKKHKIGEAEVQKLTGLSRENLGGMMELLEQGPEELAKTVDEAKKLNVHLADPNALMQFKKFHEASIKIHEAFRRISEKVVIALAPSLSHMADKFSHWIDTVNVNKFIDPLVHGMKLVVDHAKMLGKIMLANSILMRTTGGGLLTGGMRGIGAITRIGGGMGARLGGAMAGGIGRIPGLAGMMGPLQAVLPVLLRVVGSVSGLGLVAAIVLVVAKNFDKLKERLGGVVGAIWEHVQRLGESLGKIFSADAPVGQFVRWVGDKFITVVEYLGKLIDGIIQAITSFVDELDAELPGYEGRRKARIEKTYAEWDASEKAKSDLAKKTAADFTKLGGPNALQKLQESIQKRSYAFDPHHKGVKIKAEFLDVKAEKVTEQQRALYEAWKNFLKAHGQNLELSAGGKENLRRLEAAYGTKAPGTEEAPKMGVYQDFRGSRFEIEQKFAEGFDPDRVAVAFANDLASMGEKRLTSGLTPAFAIR